MSSVIKSLAMKCRLCLCFVDKQVGYSSLIDNSFSSMVKHVFSVEIPRYHFVAEKECILPLMVCNQCSTMVRSFFDFSKMVEANQKNLYSAYACPEDGDMTVDEILQSMKQECPCEELPLPSLFMSVDVEVPEGGISSIHENQHAADKDDIVQNISAISMRMSIISTKLDAALARLGNSDQFRVPIPTGITPITAENELHALNGRLADDEYMKKVFDWIDQQIPPNESGETRLQKTFDLIFSKPFLRKCSWTADSKPGTTKIALRRYFEIIKLFRRIGSTTDTVLSTSALVSFFHSTVETE